MKRSYPKILRHRKRRIRRRLDPGRAWSDQAEPIIKASNILVFAARYPKWSGAKLIHGDQSSRTLRANPLWRTNARA